MTAFLRYNKKYFIPAVLLFVVEILIAVFVHDAFVRPYLGDFLVVILLYCFMRSFLNISVWTACISVLLFSYAIETMQYFNLIHRLELQHSKFATIVLGNSFGWTDMIAYTAGIAAVISIEKISSSHLAEKKNE